jgi:hypothetical protein
MVLLILQIKYLNIYFRDNPKLFNILIYYIMSLQGIQDLDESWTLRNTLTINNNVEVLGDLNTTGFIYDGGIPVNIQGTNNVWTGKNTYTISLPTYLDPVADDEMATKNYLDTAVVGLGAGLLPLNNTFLAGNRMTGLPVISGTATPASNELVNKALVDGYISSNTGSLASNNVWSGVNTYNNVVSVPTPLTDPTFANKGYVDSAISTFNASGGKVEYVEIINTGVNAVTCDPAIYSGCIICMIASGGWGANVSPPVTSGANVKSFGGAGGYAVFKVPAFSGNASLIFIDNTYTSVGSAVFTLPNGAMVANCSGGGNATQFASGVGGSVDMGSFQGVQKITGSTEPLQNPVTNDAITRSYNIGVLNGFGNGGSFRYDTGVNVAPTIGYCLQIKFKN